MLYRQTYTQAGALARVSVQPHRSAASSAPACGTSASRSEVDQRATTIQSPVEFIGDEKIDRRRRSSRSGLLDVGSALVRDTSAFGATSPVLGQRFRLEVTPTFGDLQHDQRHASTTGSTSCRCSRSRWPAAALHVGRYGASSRGHAADAALPRLLDARARLRRRTRSGADECSITLDGSCPEFDRLFGSRIIVFNGEVRAPILGLFTGKLDYGPIPVELFGFFDAGVAWTQPERPRFVNDGTREWVTSVGVGARVNVFGFAIAEFNLAKPLNRPRARVHVRVQFPAWILRRRQRVPGSGVPGFRGSGSGFEP